jgi:hypothetical protein
MRRAVACAVAIAVLGACGSSSKSPSGAAHAQRLINQACTQFARTSLSTNPKSGIPRMTVSAAAQAYRQAALTAQSAAALDPAWAAAPHALIALADALSAQDNAAMEKAVPAARAACDPVIAAIASGTTVG